MSTFHDKSVKGPSSNLFFFFFFFFFFTTATSGHTVFHVVCVVFGMVTSGVCSTDCLVISRKNRCKKSSSTFFSSFIATSHVVTAQALGSASVLELAQGLVSTPPLALPTTPLAFLLR